MDPYLDRQEGIPDHVRQEAEWRLKELNAAYSQFQPVLNTAPPAAQAPAAQTPPTQPEPEQAEPEPEQTGYEDELDEYEDDEYADDEYEDDEYEDDEPGDAVLNPDDEPLSMLPQSPRAFDTDALWARASFEPVMIRLGGYTGLTLATPSIHDDDERVVFLSDDQGIHLARSVEGLISLAHEIGPWRELAPMITPEHVVVLPENMFDLSEAIENYANDSDGWDPWLLTAAYNLCYELALHLEIDEVEEAMAPGSALYELYVVVSRLAAGSVSRWSARQSIARFDLADVFDAWCDINDILSDHMRWHP